MLLFQLIKEQNSNFMKDFFINNTFGIVTTVIGLSVSILIFFLQTRKANSALLEKEKQVKKEIIDTVENYIINNKQVEEDSFLNLKQGIERTNGLVIDKNWNWMCLLQDISFRLQTSRHLATDQKLEYAQKLDKIINDWQIQQKINKNIQSEDENLIIEDILNKLKDQHSETKNEVIKSIYKLVELKNFSTIKKQIDFEKKFTLLTRVLTSASVGLIASVGSIFIISGLNEKYFDKKAQMSLNNNHLSLGENVVSDDYTLLIFIGIIFTIFVIFIINKLIQSKHNKFKVEINPIYSGYKKNK